MVLVVEGMVTVVLSVVRVLISSPGPPRRPPYVALIKASLWCYFGSTRGLGTSNRSRTYHTGSGSLPRLARPTSRRYLTLLGCLGSFGRAHREPWSSGKPWSLDFNHRIASQTLVTCLLSKPAAMFIGGSSYKALRKMTTETICFTIKLLL